MINKSKIKFGVIFDVDGVLINSKAINNAAIREEMAKYGVNYDELIDPAGEDHHGSSARDKLKLVKEQYDVDIDEKDFVNKVTPKITHILKNSKIKVEPGLISLLDQLEEHRVPIAIATSGRKDTTDVKLEVLGLSQRFKTIVTADDVQKHKPDPGVYLAAASKLGLGSTDCVVIEDSGTGMQAGRSAGMRVVAFTKHNGHNASSVSPDLEVEKWEDLSYDVLVGLVQKS